jgi:hypothetical protein
MDFGAASHARSIAAITFHKGASDCVAASTLPRAHAAPAAEMVARCAKPTSGATALEGLRNVELILVRSIAQTPPR